MRKPRKKPQLLITGAGLLACAAAWAGSATYDFNAGVPAGLNFVGNAEWRASGGVNNSGYMSLFDAINSLHASVLIPDFDQGLIVKAFTFEVDLRVGNAVGNGGRPADGFSISYARANDPVVLDLSQDPPVDNLNNFALGGAPENGTRTGIAISFDTWSGNTLPDGADLEGLILRVENVTKARIAMPTRNGSCSDATSLQTGPWDGLDTGDPSGLCWAPLKVVLSEDGNLSVDWKGVNIVTNLATGFSPSAGRIVFAGRTGGANENTHIDNLKITTVPSDKMIIGLPQGNAYGFDFTISDSGASVLAPATLVVTYDGAVITPVLSKPAGANVTAVSYTDLATRLAAGSSHTLAVTGKDAQGAQVAASFTYTIPDYVLVPAAYKVAGTPTVPGMKTRTHMIDEGLVVGFTARFPNNANIAANAEMQLAGGYGDPDSRIPYDNNAAPVANDITLVNWDQGAADPGGDNFNTTMPAAGPIPNDPIPGIDVGAPNDNIVVETIAYVELKKGINRMGVNSDDGFKVTVAPGQPSVTGVVLGLFNDGRGAADTLFDFVVEEDGYYPLRLLWWEGDGGANCEWFTVDRVTGEKKLVNGTATGAVKAYRNGAGRASVKSVMPANDWPGGTRTPGLKAELVDGSTTVATSSVKLLVNGADVTAQAQIAKSGTTTTVAFNPTKPIHWGQTPNWQLVWTESTTPPTTWTNHFTFRLAPDDLPAAGAFWIEAEDYDYQNGQTVAAASTMPYFGGAYDGLAGVLNVDYFDDQNEATDSGVNFTYRTDQRPNHVDVADNLGGRFGIDRPGTPSTTDLVVNYKIGWAGNFWGNYTRTVPPGIYAAYAGLSIDNSNVDGTRAPLHLVTAGKGTQNQTTEYVGTFYGRGNGGWSNNELAPLRGSDGQPAHVKVTAAQTTFRFYAESGDFDWFVLLPVDNVPAKLVQAPSALDTIRNDAARWYIKNFNTSVQAGSVKLELDGLDVTSAATITPTTDGTTLLYNPGGKGAPAGLHTYKILWTDTTSKAFEYASTLNVGPLPAANAFVIEAEDFNYDGGKANPKKGTADRDVDVMPYKGGAYDGLSAVSGVDYASSDGADSDLYRKNENPNKSMDAVLGNRFSADRGTWNVDVNYKLGWTDSGDWGNYTRTVPTGHYEVWAALSYDGRDANQLNATLGTVSGDLATTNQVVTPLGKFSAPGSGGWGANNLVPMVDDQGARQVLSLGGATTFRFQMSSGDFDFFALVPSAEVVKPKFVSIARQGGNVILEWTGGGTLQSAPAITGPWTDVPGATSPLTLPASDKMQFGRIKK